MYGYILSKDNEITNDVILHECEEFEQLRLEYPEHEVYLFLGTDVDMALFLAPGFSAILIESRASPNEFFKILNS